MWLQIIGVLGVLKFLQGRGAAQSTPKPKPHAPKPAAHKPPPVPIPTAKPAAPKPAAPKPAAAKPAAPKPAAPKPAAHKPKPATSKPALPAPKADPIAEVLAMPRPGERAPAAKPKPAAAKPAAVKPPPVKIPAPGPTPKPVVWADVQADESNREKVERAPDQAARDLLAYVNAAAGSQRATLLGYKGHPNAFVQSAQSDMGGIAADGIYGPATRARGKALIGKAFPPR